MAKIKTTCYLCGEVTKSENVPKNCPRCGANLEDPQQEWVIKKVNCQYSTSGKIFNKIGSLYLTNKRLLCINNSNAMLYGGGLVGALIASRQKWGFSLPLTDVQSFEDSKFGLFIKAFVITTEDGDVYKLSAKPREEWKEAIMQAKEELIRSLQKEIEET